MKTDHAMWPGAGFGSRKPDVNAVACMKDCTTEPKVASQLPDFARNQHGNLAEQNRLVGAQRGADTTRPAPATLAETVARAGALSIAAAPAAAAHPALALAQQHSCTACHGQDARLVGPSFSEIVGKYGSRADAVAYLAGKIKAGSTGVWGAIPMPAQALSEADALAIAQWLAAGAKK